MTHEPKCQQQLDGVGRWMGLMTDDPKLTPDSLHELAEWLDNWSYGCGQEDYYPFALQHGGPVDKLQSCAAQWKKDIADRNSWKRRYLLATENKGDE